MNRRKEFEVRIIKPMTGFCWPVKHLSNKSDRVKRVVPGIHSVKEALKVRPKRISEIWLRDGNLHDDLEVIHQEALRNRIRIKRVSQQTLEKQVHSHQGVIAHVEAAPDWPTSAELKQTSKALIFALDSIEDPHNVGSLVRSAWNLGCSGILTSKDRSAGATPAAEKIASGGFEHIPVLEVPNLASELITLKELGFWVYGLSQESSQAIFETDLGSRCVLVIGSEESGLRKPVSQACDALVSIPHSVTGQSLNASVAGAIAGYEFWRQRGLSENKENSRKKL